MEHRAGEIGAAEIRAAQITGLDPDATGVLLVGLGRGLPHLRQQCRERCLRIDLRAQRKGADA